MELQEIGIVHNDYKELKDIPRQGCFGDTVSEIEIHRASGETRHPKDPAARRA